MATIGIEITPLLVRAVRRGWRGPAAHAEVAWHPESPDDAAAALRAKLGTGTSVRLAVSPLLLRVKEVQLPDVAADQQWRAIALQPARYFAESSGGSALAVAWHRESHIAFASDAPRIAEWTRAFAALGPVTAVLPAPIALQHARLDDGTYELAAEGDSVATASIAQGRLANARMTRRSHVSTPRALPPSGTLGAEWTTALGAANAPAVEDWESLTTAETQGGLRSRRLRTLGTAAAAMVLALIGAMAALDYSRETFETRLDRAIVVAERDAQPGLAIRRRLTGLDREAQLLRASASASSDVVQTLAALSELLPRGIVVTRLRMAGDEWQASGRARGGEAAAIVPALERDARFTDVRMTSPSTRFREDAQEFESFSVAFRVRPSD